MEDNNIKNKKIFGFRSNTGYKKVLASIYYFLGICFIITLIFNWENKFELRDIIVDKIMTFLITFAYFLPFTLLSDFSENIRKKVFLLNKNKKSSTILFFVIIMIIFSVAIVELDELHSESYKEYQKEQQILEEQKMQEEQKKQEEENKQEEQKMQEEQKKQEEENKQEEQKNQENKENSNKFLDFINKNITERFTVVEHKIEKDSYLTYITGTIKNNSDIEYSYVQVEINLYDKEGNLINSTIDNINNFEANGTWKFKAMATSEFATYKIKDVTGF